MRLRHCRSRQPGSRRRRRLGKYTAYVAWAATPDLTQWARLGTVSNGTSRVGPVDFNKFLFVISAEASDTVDAAQRVRPCCTGLAQRIAADVSSAPGLPQLPQ